MGLVNLFMKWMLWMCVCVGVAVSALHKVQVQRVSNMSAEELVVFKVVVEEEFPNDQLTEMISHLASTVSSSPLTLIRQYPLTSIIPPCQHQVTQIRPCQHLETPNNILPTPTDLTLLTAADSALFLYLY
ncbi:hypothetical protein Pmani_034171 [Petrolisthes manimaculis]|uniref:Uncharacterized protein n=1 Tax=Petrolisthes manimaculis TaxID=1843537 RepID=A0AAE1NPA4_9EUCA|nr:hypothetical protein Pmani_034171 [Petrolisthes manimaculis]